MKDFFVKIVFNNGSILAYRKLKLKMIEAGFSKVITAKNKRRYLLPQGCYKAESSKDIDHIYTVAYNVAKIILQNPTVFVNEYANAMWAHLDPAGPEDR